MADPIYTVTRQELARLLDITPDRVTRLVSEGLPILAAGGGRGKPSRFDLAAVLPWIWKRQVGGAREQYYRAQTQKVEQDIRRRAGELVEAADVERRWAGLVVAARERLLSLPTMALQRGVPSQHEDLLIALVDEALTELAARGDARG